MQWQTCNHSRSPSGPKEASTMPARLVCPRAAAASVVALFHVASCSAQAPKLLLPVPAPLPDHSGNLSAVVYAVGREQRASIVLAQVVHVTPIRGIPSSATLVAHPTNEQEIPSVQGG